MKSVSDRIIDRLPAGGSIIVAAFGSSYERLTTDNACVLLIDHQIGPLWELEFAETRRRAVELAGGAKRLAVPTVITAIGVSILLQTLAMMIWSRNPLPFPQLLPTDPINVIKATDTTPGAVISMTGVSMTAALAGGAASVDGMCVTVPARDRP